MPLEHRLHTRCGCASLAGAERATSSGRPFAFPGSSRHFERDRLFSIDHLALDLTLDVTAKRIRAEAALDVRRVAPTATVLALDAIGFDVKDATVDGRSVDWRYDGRTIEVPIEVACEKARVVIRYWAVPRRGLYFLEPDEYYPARPQQVWSQCQEEDARHWFPCHDSPHLKMTTEMVVRVPNGWYALSNGALASSNKPNAGEFTYHWKMDEPHASYLVTLVAGEFSEITTEVTVAARNVPVAYLVPKGREEDGRRSFLRTPEMIKHFSEVTGVAYPWNKYAQVVVSDFIFGGMENTTATTLYEHILLDERAAIDISSDDLIAHELAHQWFGDYVTCRAWYEAWLNEGFATFFEHVWREKHLGRDEYDFGLKVDLDGYFAEAKGRYRRPIVCQEYDAPLDLFDRHLYEKGALVLHALRTEVGDATFWRGVRLYLERNARGIVESRDLQRAMEEASGRGLGRLFEQWLYKPGHPEIEVEVAWEDGVLNVSTKQSQSTVDGVPACFELSLTMDLASDPAGTGSERAPVGGAGNVVRRSMKVTEKAQSFALAAPERPSFVVIDPEMCIVGEVRPKVPADMLRRQLSSAPTARGRWLAAQALARVDDPSSIEALVRTLSDEQQFWGVRAECAGALGKIRMPECFEGLKNARQTPHPKVRRAVLNALGDFHTAEAMDAIKPLALHDSSYLVEGEAAHALGRTRQAGAFDILIDLLERPSWFDVVRAGAIDGLAALRDDRAVPHLAARVRYGHPSRARRASILALPKLAWDRKVRETLEQQLEDPDPLLRIDAVRALGELGDTKARPALRDRFDSDLDPRVRRRIRETIRDLGESRRLPDPMREELDRLSAEHAALKARLARLETQSDEARSGAAQKAPRTKKRSKAKGAKK